jgi:hypothetical protein
MIHTPTPPKLPFDTLFVVVVDALFDPRPLAMTADVPSGVATLFVVAGTAVVVVLPSGIAVQARGAPLV